MDYYGRVSVKVCYGLVTISGWHVNRAGRLKTQTMPSAVRSVHCDSGYYRKYLDEYILPQTPALSELKYF